MNKIIFTEEYCQPERLHPFTLTRQIQDIRVGILTIREKWEKMMGLPSFDRKEDDYKDLDHAISLEEALGEGPCFMIHSNVLPTPALIRALKNLKDGEFLSQDNAAIGFRFSRKKGKEKMLVNRTIQFTGEIKTIQYPWDIFLLNDWAIRQDFALLTRGKQSQRIPPSNKVTGRKNIFLEKGAKVTHSILNADTGPIYIGNNAEILEGSLIRGPFSMGEKAVVKMGAKIYGATTIGPFCMAGGEIKNSVLSGYSNKAHDGYLGDAVIGEWCNMGAGTSNSNIKNNASVVKVWTVAGQQEAGLKCGVIMGDYSRTAINTSINTGTVIGVSCNVFGNGLTPAYIPSFSWGSDGIRRYELEKALEDIGSWKKLKGKELTENEKAILHYIFAHY